MEKIINRLKSIGEHDIADLFAAAMDDLHGLCSVCRHNNTKVCDSCTHTPKIFEVYGDADNWEWRGLGK